MGMERSQYLHGFWERTCKAWEMFGFDRNVNDTKVVSLGCIQNEVSFILVVRTLY
jgi:hypothetical protein